MASINSKSIIATVIGVLIGSILTVITYHYFLMPVVHPQALTSDQMVKPTERKVLFWYDPMYPNTKFDKPGPSPFMDMDLVPKYAEEDSDGSEIKPGIKIDPTQTQNLGLRTAQATYGKLVYTQTIPANLAFNEYQYAIVQSRSEGFIDKVYPLTVGDKVSKGSPLIELTIPAWVEAQSEYLVLLKQGAPMMQINGALERLRLSGMSPENIQLLRDNKKIQTRFVINAPMDGVITAFDVRTGMNIGKDSMIAKIQGIDPIWLNAAVPESMTYLVNDQTQFLINIPAFPDQTFKIQQWHTLPSIDPVTRTLSLRLQLDNQHERLKPGMNAFITLQDHSENVLLIPSQAIIDTGAEQRVITINQQGRFVPKRVKIFRQSQQQTALLSGLNEGETVVISGLFMIDSEANISGALDRMRQDDPPASEHSRDAMQSHQ